MAFRAAVYALGFAALVAAAPTATTESEISQTIEKRVTHSGTATYYTQDGAAGSCGQYHSDSDYIVALSPYWMNQGGFCGRTISVTNEGGGQSNNGKGKTITVTVADTCPGCDENHIDFAEGPFKALTGGNLDPPGAFNIAWHFNAQ